MLPLGDLPAYCYLKITVMQRIIMAFHIGSPLWTRSQGIWLQGPPRLATT